MRSRLASLLGWWWSSDSWVRWWSSRAVLLRPWPRECCSNTRRRRAQGSTGPLGIVETSEHSGRWPALASGRNRQRLAKRSSIRPRSGEGRGRWAPGFCVGSKCQVPAVSWWRVQPRWIIWWCLRHTSARLARSVGPPAWSAMRWWASVQWDGRGQSGTRQPRSRCFRARRWARFARRVVRPRSRISDPLVTTRRRAASMSQDRIREGGTGP